MIRLSCAAAVAVLVLGSAPAPGQPGPLAEPAVLRGESAQTRKRLAEAEQKLIGGKAADAVDDLQRILDEAGDDLVSVDGRHHRPARWVVHQILAKLPPDMLQTYRDRIDEPARKLLDAGRRDRDSRPLWQLLDRYYVSRPGEEGLLLLGDLLFERGEFRTAELLWRRLLPDAAADVPYPAPKTDPAVVRARAVLAAIFQGERDRAKAELGVLRAKYPTAAGVFAGKTGPYVDTLQAFIDHPPLVVPDPVGGRDWPTFAGDPGRTGRVHGSIPVHWPTRPTWTALIPQDKSARRTDGPSHFVHPPFGHPVIADGRVYLSDGSRVTSFDLRTGRMGVVPVAPQAAMPDPARQQNDSARRANDPDPCSVLTAAGGRLYARIGQSIVRAPEPLRVGKAAEDSAIVCFAPPAKPGRNSPPMRELWRVAPPAAEGKGPGVWEGTPLVASGRMWAALARFEGGRVVHAVAAFDPADPDRAPDRPAWVVDVCDSPLPPTPEGQSRARQELLTLAGRNVVLCSNGGAVVAVDAATGRRAWGFQYPRSSRRAVDAALSSEPSPAVAAGGRVFAAPADADRVFALDAETGQLLWESGPVEGAQILGITRGRVVVTTTGPVRGIRALGIATGSYREPDGWIQHDGGGLLGYGRGLVTDDVIVWPSRAGLYFLDPDTGRPYHAPLRTMLSGPQELLFGNVVYADGVLVVVTPTKVWGYVTDAPPFVRPPDPEPRVRFEALIDRAERELAGGDQRAARATLLGVARGDLPAAWRAWAAARLLMLAPPTDDLARLPRDVRDALTPELLGEWLLTADGEIVSLATLADRHVGRAPPPPGLPAPPTLTAGHKQPDIPVLGPDARVVATAQLPPNAFPLRPIAGAVTRARHVFAATPQVVVAVPFDQSDPITRTAGDAFTHAADLPDGFVAAGPLAVAVYGSGRDPTWVFRVPDTDPLPGQYPRPAVRAGESLPPPHLSSFVLAGEWLLARLGEHHLLALDLKGRRVVWVLGAHGRPRFEPVLFPTAPRFEPYFYAGGRLVVAQLSDGRRWLIQTATGRVWDDGGATFEKAVPAGYGEKTAQVRWPHPPVEIAGNRIAFSDGPGLVRVDKLVAGRFVKWWAYEADGESSLAGDPPQIRGWEDLVLVAVRRSHGVELDRLDPTDGKSTWTGGPVFLDASRVDLGAADADPVRVYVPAGGKLFALALDDGKAVWEADLPDAAGSWVVRAGRKVVIVFPEEAIPEEPVGRVWDRTVASFLRYPLGWRLPWLAIALYDAWADRTVPVLLFDPESGQLLKRLTVPARGPGVTAWFDADRAVVATGAQVTWLR